MKKLHFIKNKELNRVASLHLFLGLITIPINLIIASSLAKAVSSVTNSTQEFFLYHTGLFVAFSLVCFLITIFRKSFLTRLESKALQSYRQSLYQRFMQQIFCSCKAEPNSFTTLFRRDAAKICRFYSNTLPAFGVAVIGFIAYQLYVCFALKGGIFALCMTVLGLMNLLQPIILEKFLVKNFIAADEAEAALAEHLTTGREGFASIKLLNLHDWYMKQYLPKQKNMWKAGMLASASGTFNSAMIDINKFLQTLGLAAILGLAILKQWITVANALEIYMLSGSIYTYLTTILQIKSDSAAYRAALQLLNKYMPEENNAVEILPLDKDKASDICALGLSYQINKKVLMKNLSFSISPGEKCLLCGENGVGKSTLLAMILGEVAPSEGKILLNGEEITAGKDYSRNRIAYCPQKAPSMQCTVQELFEKVLHAQDNLSEQLLYEYAKELGLSREDMAKHLDTLSGGTQKKVILCLALAKQAPLLLLDEPEAMLDQPAVEALLRILKRKECTVIIVTHSPLYQELANSVLTFQNKQIVSLTCNP